MFTCTVAPIHGCPNSVSQYQRRSRPCSCRTLRLTGGSSPSDIVLQPNRCRPSPADSSFLFSVVGADHSISSGGYLPRPNVASDKCPYSLHNKRLSHTDLLSITKRRRGWDLHTVDCDGEEWQRGVWIKKAQIQNSRRLPISCNKRQLGWYTADNSFGRDLEGPLLQEEEANP